MAFPTAVNDQITDSVTQANVKVLSDAPAMAMGNLYQATAQGISDEITSFGFDHLWNSWSTPGR